MIPSFDEAICAIFAPICDRLEAIECRLQSIEGRINRVLGMELSDARRDKMASKAMEHLMREVTENRDAVSAVEALIADLAQQIRDAGGDQDALNKLADDLDANTGRLGKAVTDNTPFQPSGQ